MESFFVLKKDKVSKRYHWNLNNHFFFKTVRERELKMIKIKDKYYIFYLILLYLLDLTNCTYLRDNFPLCLMLNFE